MKKLIIALSLLLTTITTHAVNRGYSQLHFVNVANDAINKDRSIKNFVYMSLNCLNDDDDMFSDECEAVDMVNGMTLSILELKGFNTRTTKMGNLTDEEFATVVDVAYNNYKLLDEVIKGGLKYVVEYIFPMYLDNDKTVKENLDEIAELPGYRVTEMGYTLFSLTLPEIYKAFETVTINPNLTWSEQSDAGRDLIMIILTSRMTFQ